MKTKKFEYQLLYYTMILIAITLLFSIISCKKEDKNNNKPKGATYEGRYKDVTGNYCVSKRDSVLVYYDNNGQLYIKSADYWTCDWSLAMTESSNNLTMNTIYIPPGGVNYVSITATGRIYGDSIILDITNSMHTGYVDHHKYIKQ